MAADGRARTTTREPSGTSANRSRIRCRSRRLTRLRTTAGPTPFDTTKPTEVTPPVPVTTWVTREGPPALRPRRTVVLKSRPSLMRWARPSKAQADSLARPLRRRSARMARPARVRIRRRKPCFLLRRRLFGWKVRLLTVQVLTRGARRGPRRKLADVRVSSGTVGPSLLHDRHRTPANDGLPCRGHAAPVVRHDLTTVRAGPKPVKPTPCTASRTTLPHDTPMGV